MTAVDCRCLRGVAPLVLHAARAATSASQHAAGTMPFVFIRVELYDPQIATLVRGPLHAATRRTPVATVRPRRHLSWRRVPDPFRWLEDAGESRDARVGRGAERADPSRSSTGPRATRWSTRLTKLYDYPRTGVPFKRGSRYFFTHNTGLQDQPILYVQDGPDGAPRVLIDPNVMRREGTVALTAMAPDDSGRSLAYALSDSGSDRQEIRVRDVGHGRDRPIDLHWVKFVSHRLDRVGRGLLLHALPGAGHRARRATRTTSTASTYHRLGERQDQDALVFEKPAGTRDGLRRGRERRRSLGRHHRVSRHQRQERSLPRSTVEAPARRPVAAVHRLSMPRTRSSSPRADGCSSARTRARRSGGSSRSIREHPARRRSKSCRSRADKLSTAVIVHDTIVASYLHNASDRRAAVRSRRAARRGTLTLPAIGSVTGSAAGPTTTSCSSGSPRSRAPPASFRYDFKPVARAVPSGPVSATGAIGGRSRGYQTTQVWYPSKDGTRVSMFLVHRTDSRATADARCC